MSKSYIVKIPASTYLKFQVWAEGKEEALKEVRMGKGNYEGRLLPSHLKELNFTLSNEDDKCEVGEEINEYEVTVKEIHKRILRVEAKNEEEAKRKVANGKGEVLLETSGATFVETCSLESWYVTKVDEK